MVIELKPRYDQFLAHLLPALFLFTFGLWWIIAPIFIYLRTKMTIKPYKSMASYPFPGTCKCSVESLYKILLGTVVLAAEITLIVFNYKGIPVLENWAHILMVVSLLVNGVTDMMTSRGVKVPKVASYVTLIGFFASVCGYLIYHNYTDIEALRRNATSDIYEPTSTIPRGHLDKFLHLILLGTFASVIVFLGMEMVCKNRVLVSMCRGAAVVLTSTWMVHVGVVLNPPFGLPTWNQDQVDISLIFGYYAAHAAAVSMATVAIFILLYFKHKKANNWIMRIADPSEVERFIQ